MSHSLFLSRNIEGGSVRAGSGSLAPSARRRLRARHAPMPLPPGGGVVQRCGGGRGVLLLCGRFDWGLPRKHLFLSRIIEGGATAVGHAATIHLQLARTARRARHFARASAPFPSWSRSILPEIYLCHACSYHEIEDGNGAPGTPGAGRRAAAVSALPPRAARARPDAARLRPPRGRRLGVRAAAAPGVPPAGRPAATAGGASAASFQAARFD
jgi:hypothetical protein